jgi:hypothetical protein
MYDNPWLIDDKPYTGDDIKKYYGFVYLIINKQTKRKYIGRKYFWHFKRVKGRRKKVESDWKEYYGSSKSLIEDVTLSGKDNFTRIILSLHKTKGDVNYYEVKEQFQRNVLETSEYYNDNINGKWYFKPDHIQEGRRINQHWEE